MNVSDVEGVNGQSVNRKIYIYIYTSNDELVAT